MTSGVIAREVVTAPTLVPTQERGQRAVFCGLTSIIWLHRKIQDAFFLVVGSRTCAHLIQSAAGVMIFAEPRFGTAVLQDRDLAGMANCTEELDRVIAQVLARRPNLKTLFLVSSCPSEVIKLDLDNAAERLAAEHQGSLRVVAYSGSGIETTFTQGEDSCLRNLVPSMPALESSEKRLMIVGTLPDIVEDQFTRLFTAMGVEHIDFFPGRRSEILPPVGENTHLLLAQPYLGDTARALQARGAQRIGAPYPLGVEGTRRWFEAAGEALGVASAQIASVLSAPVERARKSMERFRDELGGRRIMFLPDSQLEIPLARFLHEECDAELVEVGTPYYDAEMMAGEIAKLPEGVAWMEGQDLDPALDRVRASRPDLTVCGLGIANPLEAEGLRTKWSIELMFSPIQGFEQAADLAELFARPLRREARLEVGTWS